jgi:hypothetical protein
VKTRRAATGLILAASFVVAACGPPIDPFSRDDLIEPVIQVDKEAERRIDEMMRETQELLELERKEPLPMTGLGGG